jgi:hypothetical protein
MSTATTVEDISGAGTGSKALKKVPLPTASLGDAKLLRELLLLRTSLLKADVKLTGAYTGPPIPMATEAMTRIYKLMQNASLAKFCEVHLRLNDLHYESYELTEKRLEDVETRSDNTDFYMAAKIDTHLHLSAILTSPELLSYLNEIYARDGHLPYDSKQTIGEMILAAGFEPGRTAIDDLRTQSTPDMYRDFDEFNSAFTPFRSKALADLLFKPTVLGGRYLKEILTRMADKVSHSSNSRPSASASPLPLTFTIPLPIHPHPPRPPRTTSFSSRACRSTRASTASGPSSPTGLRVPSRSISTCSSPSNSRASITCGWG